MPADLIHPMDRVRANLRIPHAEIDGETVLMNVERGRYYGLDDIGSAIFRRIHEPAVVGVLCDELAREYGADRTLVERDVVALLTAMAENGLVSVTGTRQTGCPLQRAG